MKKFRIMALMAMAVGLYSCSNEDNPVIVDNNQVEINEGTVAAIEGFINQVNGMAVTRGYPLYPENPDPPGFKLREYIPSKQECEDGKGSCLPEVIVTPVYPGKPGSWNATSQGRQLQGMVDNNQITMKKDFNGATNTEYYIYNGVENKNLEIVVPVAYK